MAKATASRSAAEAVLSALNVLLEPDQVAELRAVKVKEGNYRPYTVAGFFDHDHRREMAKEALRLTERSKGVYFTLNHLKPDCLHRRANRVDRAEEGELAKDADVSKRTRLLLDIDPVRDALISATEEERKEAHRLAFRVRECLTQEHGWPEPVWMDSGNGAYLLYAIDLPADDGGLAKRVLEALADRHDTDGAKIDRKVFNPARIAKVPGTWGRKGDSTEERPHRQSMLLEVPGCLSMDDLSTARLEVVSREQLEAVGGQAPQGEKASDWTRTAGASGSNGEFHHKLNVERWLGEYHRGYRRKPQPDAHGRTVYVLDACPFDPSHRNPDACIMQDSSGKLSAQCFHNTCGGRGWQEFKAAIGLPHPDHYDPPLTGPSGPSGQKQQRTGTDGQKESQYRTRFITSAELVHQASRPVFLVKRLLVGGQPGVQGGPRKALKTSTMVDLAVSVATGTPFLGTFEVPAPARVGIISGESGDWTLLETARRVCLARGIDLEGIGNQLLWDFDLPSLSSEVDMAELRGAIRKSELKLLLLDPLYLCLLNGQSDLQASNLFDMGPLLRSITQACLSGGCTPLLVHHSTKRLSSQYEPMELEDLAFAGIQEFARQWLLVNRREGYEQGSGVHRLWLSAGGSCGHGGLWSVDVDEGVLADDFTGRVWQVTVSSPGESRQASSEAKQEAKLSKEQEELKRAGTKLLNQLDRLCRLKQDQDGIVKEKTLREVCKFSGNRMSEVVLDLIENGHIERAEARASCGPGGRGGRVVNGLKRAGYENRENRDKTGTEPGLEASPSIENRDWDSPPL